MPTAPFLLRISIDNNGAMRPTEARGAHTWEYYAHSVPEDWPLEIPALQVPHGLLKTYVPRCVHRLHWRLLHITCLTPGAIPKKTPPIVVATALSRLFPFPVLDGLPKETLERLVQELPLP